MPAKQIPGWTRKGPGTFTSDEFDSDDQTPPNSVSKVTSNKPIPSADTLLTAKNVAGEEPISSADTLPAVQNYIQNFAAYLGLREISDKILIQAFQEVSSWKYILNFVQKGKVRKLSN